MSEGYNREELTPYARLTPSPLPQPRIYTIKYNM